MAKGVRTVKVECAYDEMTDTGALIPNPKNPNKHPQRQIDLLKKIILYQGWRNPIVVSRRSGFITKGHARLEAAVQLKLTTCPVDYQEYATEADEWADMIADNRLAELADSSEEEMKALLAALAAQKFDLDLTGFDSIALEELNGIEVWHGDNDLPEGDGSLTRRVIITFDSEVEEADFWARLKVEHTIGKILYHWNELKP